MRLSKIDLQLIRHVAQNHMNLLLESDELDSDEKEALSALTSFIADHCLEYLLYGYSDTI